MLTVVTAILSLSSCCDPHVQPQAKLEEWTQCIFVQPVTAWCSTANGNLQHRAEHPAAERAAPDICTSYQRQMSSCAAYKGNKVMFLPWRHWLMCQETFPLPNSSWDMFGSQLCRTHHGQCMHAHSRLACEPNLVDGGSPMRPSTELRPVS